MMDLSVSKGNITLIVELDTFTYNHLIESNWPTSPSSNSIPTK